MELASQKNKNIRSEPQAIEAEKAVLGSMLLSKEDAFEKLVNKYKNIESSLPEKMLKYARLAREVAIAQEIYFQLQKKYEETCIEEASNSAAFRILDRATYRGEVVN